MARAAVAGGLAFVAAVVMRQIGVGVLAERIQETQDAAKLTLLVDLRLDGAAPCWRWAGSR